MSNVTTSCSRLRWMSCLREAHRHRESLPRRPVGERERRAVGWRDRVHDRQPEPAAGRCGPGATVEAIEHPRALRGWNAGTIVAHRETRAPCVTRGLLDDGHVEPAAGGG